MESKHVSEMKRVSSDHQQELIVLQKAHKHSLEGTDDSKLKVVTYRRATKVAATGHISIFHL